MEAVSRHEDPALFGGLYSRESFFDDESDSTRSVALPCSAEGLGRDSSSLSFSHVVNFLFG